MEGRNRGINGDSVQRHRCVQTPLSLSNAASRRRARRMFADGRGEGRSIRWAGDFTDCGINCGRKDSKTPHKTTQHSITILLQSLHNTELPNKTQPLTKTLDLNFESAASAIPPLRLAKILHDTRRLPKACSWTAL